MTRHTLLGSVSFFVLVTALIATTARDARAQGFVSPFIGADFGGDSACPSLPGCQEKRVNWGVSVGAMGDFLGFEEEFAYANDFFGTSPGLSSSVLTLMSNIMVIPKIGPVHPYGVGGVGLIKPHVELSTSSLLTTDNNQFGWDVGGGVMVFVADRVGVRGDIRHFHSFQDLTIPIVGVNLGGSKLSYGRASAAVVFKF